LVTRTVLLNDVSKHMICASTTMAVAIFQFRVFKSSNSVNGNTRNR
jgi:hypothetical protein